MINGKRWTIGIGFPGKTKGVVDDGVCKYSNKRIIIHGIHRGRVRSTEETIIHEVAHAVLPQIDETTIEHLADVSARILAKVKKAEEDSKKKPAKKKNDS